VEFEEASSASRPDHLTMPIANLRLPIGILTKLGYLLSHVRIINAVD
jgi:hypothetical protein